ncbi:multicopper oxidase family protein [Tenggerimyces flavus]|uniref:Multicopper oxidase CueO n=1 Tax=Tenggerimyces flavus TaxID=1708749 RepID=A0ABV7YFJ4_9ACTN|nr:multicopper oxidase family protein [Tenggerimyces flavus]MBM7786917.1 FtsP/CotA-like multicopper oxidase with cupredoxin domain [Tenggerimyces flavus]
MSRLSRRGLLGLAGAAAVAGSLAGCQFLNGQTGQVLRSEAPLPKPFTVPLPIPPVKKPIRTDGATDYYEIVQREATAEILPGLKTKIFGYDGVFPGPTIEARSGRKISVRHRNDLPVPTAVHLHGGHTPAEHDGSAIDLCLPNDGWKPSVGHDGEPAMLGKLTTGERSYVYPSDQRAATLWYHDHRMDFTAPQVYRGLAGFHLVRDDEEGALSLPSGSREIPLMITDRSFDADGTFLYPSSDASLRGEPGIAGAYMEGLLGDVVLVNGAPWPVLEVDSARYRFRLLNASNARRYRLMLNAGGKNVPFVQIGSDGGLLAQPSERTSIDLAAGERFDVVVDFSSFAVGTEVTLTNGFGEAPGTVNVMRFRVAKKVRDDARVPARLSTVETLDPAKAVRTREWKFQRGNVGDHKGWRINQRSYDPRRVDADPKLGEIEIWRFVSDLHHPVHVHLDPFQVVSRRGKGPGDLDAGWKDTVDVKPTEIVDVAVRFSDYTGPYLMHCHNLEHEDMAMMATFQTT